VHVRYEGYGPGGAAIIIDCLTDNRDRTAPEIRSVFDKHGGNLGKPGSVSFGFDQKGLIIIESTRVSEDKLMEIALAAGAEDVAEVGGAWQVTCAPAEYLALKEAIESTGLAPDSAQLTFVPHLTVPCDAVMGAKVLRLLDALEENDDVQKVYSNADIPEAVLARAG
jgi:YebC/PmpR family DNA-binding regulatory protein